MLLNRERNLSTYDLLGGNATRDRPYYGRLPLHDREAAVGAVPLTSGVTLLSTKVEYKHGQQGEWLNDAIQVCAQALCLEVCWKEKEDDE